MQFTVGMYLAERLVQIGVRHHFAVAGDYNLILLDQLLTNQQSEQIYCSNELNCSFAAEGYARARGVAACIVTFGVGALSATAGIGGAYAENLPVILISGAPNSNDIGSGRVLHHTPGRTDAHFQLNMMREITCAAEEINDVSSAPAKIDHVIRTALAKQKPAYLSIACNIADAPCVRPGPMAMLLPQQRCDEASLEAAIEATLSWLKTRDKVVILVGSKIRAAQAQQPTIALADKLGCPVAVMAAAKSFFPEVHPSFRGVYWGNVSDPGVEDLVNGADAVICLAPVFNDYSTVGWQAMPLGEHVLVADTDHVTISQTRFDGFSLTTFISALTRRSTQRKPGPVGSGPQRFSPAPAPSDERLTNDEMLRQVQNLLTSETTLFAETGDSWFNAMRLAMPGYARLEVEMQWGHIGWSIPSIFGNAMGSQERRHVAMVGDGSFQLTAQEVAQMIRQKLPVIIFLINNRGYVIEIAIHDGPYNQIKNWDYAGLIEVFNAEDGHGLGLHAKTGAELADAIERALRNREGPTLIECALDPNDCTEALRIWGKQVSGTNARPANAL